MIYQHRITKHLTTITHYTSTNTVLEFDRGADGELGNLGKKILQKKFEAHNKAWLGAVREEYASHGYNSSMIGASMGGDERFYHDRVSSVFNVTVLWVYLLVKVSVQTSALYCIIECFVCIIMHCTDTLSVQYNILTIYTR